MFSPTRHYPYSPPQLDFLTDKTSTFLLQQFHLIFAEHQKASVMSTPLKHAPRKKKRKIASVTIRSLTMGDLDQSALPAGYHTTYPPIPNACDHCKSELAQDPDGTVLICGHGYHWNCYNQMGFKCRHCLEYFKKGVWTNVNAFLKRLNAGQDTLTQEDMEDNDQEDVATEQDPTEEEEEDLMIDEREKVSLELQNAMHEINQW